MLVAFDIAESTPRHVTLSVSAARIGLSSPGASVRYKFFAEVTCELTDA